MCTVNLFIFIYLFIFLQVSSICIFQNLGNKGKVQVQTDEWRNDSVEGRLEYSLVKVSTFLTQGHTMTLLSIQHYKSSRLSLI